MAFSPVIEELIGSLSQLPGVGRKSAQRMAFQLLERNRHAATRLSEALSDAVEKVGRCNDCRSLSEHKQCELCADDSRDNSLICVVETPADVLAMEATGGYRGRYFVLMGHLSPIDGIGPEDIGLDRLLERVDALSVAECILATNPTVEGEATAWMITEQMQERGIKVSRIAQGVPLGGELEYVDSGTLAHAISGRRPVN